MINQFSSRCITFIAESCIFFFIFLFFCVYPQGCSKWNLATFIGVNQQIQTMTLKIKLIMYCNTNCSNSWTKVHVKGKCKIVTALSKPVASFHCSSKALPPYNLH
ncbi:hypothetical protein BD408DRAFT_415639 [Parasitella parasitica]|nr:hypothetical protein BD408DRAFT_415639 [Parasitella parasitica]